MNTSGVPFIAGLILFGIVGFTIMPLMILILMDSPEIDARYMGSAGGMFFCVGEIGGFTCPIIVGALVDLTGSFLMGVSFLAILSLAVLAMTFLLRTQKKVEVASL